MQNLFSDQQQHSLAILPSLFFVFLAIAAIIIIFFTPFQWTQMESGGILYCMTFKMQTIFSFGCSWFRWVHWESTPESVSNAPLMNAVRESSSRGCNDMRDYDFLHWYIVYYQLLFDVALKVYSYIFNRCFLWSSGNTPCMGLFHIYTHWHQWTNEHI